MRRSKKEQSNLALRAILKDVYQTCLQLKSVVERSMFSAVADLQNGFDSSNCALGLRSTIDCNYCVPLILSTI